MRSLPLEASLTELFTEAGAHLRAEVAAGAEVPFEVGAQRSRRIGAASTLYCYRALTGEFIAEREPALRRLPAYAEAAGLLEHFDGLDRYLAGLSTDSARSKGRASVHAALKALLAEVFDEQSEFELREERIGQALERLQGSALASAGELALVVGLHGVTIASEELPLTKGLRILERDALPELPDAAAPIQEGELSERPLVVLYTDEPDDPGEGIHRGRAVLRDLLSALRLFGDGRVTLGPLAWARVGSGPWTPVALGSGGRPHGMLIVTVEQEDELRAFCNLVSRRAPHDNDLAWALRRFELACERENPFEGLTDNLLALRALLEPEGPASGRLAGRLAALCATPEQRGALTERMTRALALERSLIAGTASKNAANQSLAEDLAGHLRSLLRDVICGHLEPDLAVIADELLEPDELLHVDEDREGETELSGELPDAADSPHPATEVVSSSASAERVSAAPVVAEPGIAAASISSAAAPDVLRQGELRARRVRETPLRSRMPTLMPGEDPSEESEFFGADVLADELDRGEHSELIDGVHAVGSYGEALAVPDADVGPEQDVELDALPEVEQPELPIDGVVSTFN